MFIESSSFALSTVAGIGMVKGGLALLLMATPVGWVGLVIGGLAIAGSAAGASMLINGQVKNDAGGWYDSIQAWVNKK